MIKSLAINATYATTATAKSRYQKSGKSALAANQSSELSCQAPTITSFKPNEGDLTTVLTKKKKGKVEDIKISIPPKQQQGTDDRTPVRTKIASPYTDSSSKFNRNA